MRKYIIAIIVALSLPSLTLAADSNISSLRVTPSSTVAGATTSYTFSVGLATDHTMGTDNKDMTFFFATKDAGVPDDTGYSFENSTMSPVLNFTAESSEAIQNNEAWTMDVDFTSSYSTSWQIGMNNVKNPTDGCYKLMATTEDPGPSANYTESSTFTIGDGSCADNSSEEVTKPKKPKKVKITKKTKKKVNYRVVLKDASDRPTKVIREIRWKKKGTTGKWTKWKKKNKKAVSTSSTNTKWNFTYKKLKPGTTYQVRAWFKNEAGKSKKLKKKFTTNGTFEG